MNQTVKALLLSGSIVLLGALCTATKAQAQESDYGVKVQVNDQLVEFPDDQPYIDANGRLLVPVRFVSERMGYKVEGTMEGSAVSVTITSGNQKIVLKTGESQALLNGRKADIGTAAVFTQGRVYVPLRFLSESFGSRVQWDQENKIAILDADGRYHAPAWYAPKSPKVVDIAKQYVGVPYQWGGTSPNGFDCSGFVQYVFEQYGTELPRSSEEMFRDAGVPTTDPQPGDLVFFTKTGSIVNHVGIYMGDNQFISATNSSGIHIDSLDSGYWGSRYIGAKKVL